MASANAGNNKVLAEKKGVDQFKTYSCLETSILDLREKIHTDASFPTR